MAILEKLRVRAGLLLAIVIGLSLLAFVLSDFLDSGGSLFTRSKYEIAEISGKSVPYNDFEVKVSELENIQKIQTGQTGLDEETMDQIRNATWDNMIQDMIMDKQYEKVGVEVSDEELKNLIAGDNPHPAIAQLFTDPQTGIFNRQVFNSFIQRIQNETEETPEKTYYIFLENEIYKQRKNTKYLNLVRKGLYSTALEAGRQQLESARALDVDYVVQNFSTISDSAIQVSEADVKKYYEAHLNQYKQEESRDLRYVYFTVTPSKADYQAAKDYIDNILPDFEKAEDIRQFVSLESDVPFDEKNYNNGELADTLNDFMFRAAEGAIFGPWFEDNAYRIARLAAIHYLPDSVKARHILLRSTADLARLQKEADSLVSLIRNGADFGSLAMLYSADGSAQKGGDLGWFREGEMVQAFSDSCFHSRKGEIKIVTTQYGIHIVEIMDQSPLVKQVQLGTLVKNVTPSEATDHEFYVKANEFAGQNNTYEKFNKAIETGKLEANTQVALRVAPMDKNINDLPSARQLVTWAYQADEHEVSSTVFKFGYKYVVATVDKVREKGYTPLADVKADVENKVRQEKKAEKLIAQISSKAGNAKTLDELAKSLGLQPQPVAGLRFISSSLGNAGVEPNVIAAACALPKGVVSKPIAGENGVYVLYVNNITEPAENDLKSGLPVARNYVERNYGAMANYYAYEALKEMAKIKDNRRMFY